MARGDVPGRAMEPGLAGARYNTSSGQPGITYHRPYGYRSESMSQHTRTVGPVLGLMAAMLVLPGPAAAADGPRNQLSIGTYAIGVDYDDYRIPDDDLSGNAISYTHIFERVALRVNLYGTDHDDIPGLDVDGSEILLLGGSNLAGEGFKIYGGGGFFGETWESPSEETDISGLELVGGLGYNWKEVAVDFTVGLRRARDYEDRKSALVGRNVDAGAASSSLTVGIRF